jgi:dolichol-phosphate mannosyltransferase
MPKTIVVIPTYNEADNLERITAAIFDLNVEELEILVVDDASPDGTGNIADQLSLRYPGRFNVLHRSGKLGLGSAYCQGFTWAINRGAKYIIQMDADFSHSPSYLPQMLSSIPEYDVVVGSRYVKGGSTDERWSWYRRLLSWWANSVWVRVILGTKTHDATAGFKCWQANALRGIELENICSTGYVFAVEMCYISERKRYRIKEIPIYFPDRRIGTSKMDNRIKIEAALRVFDIRRRYHKLQPNPDYVRE